MRVSKNIVGRLLTERDLARITGLSTASVRRWRIRGHGPRYLTIGAAVRYHPDDLAVWLCNRRGEEPVPSSKTTMAMENLYLALNFLLRISSMVMSIHAKFFAC